MSWSNIQNAFANDATATGLSVSKAFTNPVTAGSIVSGVVIWDNIDFGAVTLSNVTDDKGNTYTINVDTVVDVPNSQKWSSFYATSFPNGLPTTITANFSGSNGFFGIVIKEDSPGAGFTVALDGHNATFATAGSGVTGANLYSSGSATTTANGDLVNGFCISDTGTPTPTAGTSPNAFTQRISTAASSTAFAVGSEDFIQTTAGSIAATFGTSTAPGATAFGVFMLAFKALAAGGSTGSSTGTGTASGIGASLKASVGTSAGTGTASATGSGAIAIATQGGIGKLFSPGLGERFHPNLAFPLTVQTVSATGSSSGIGTASGIGASTATSVASASGVGSAPGIGASAAASVGTSTGTGTATGVSASASASVGSSSGVGIATGVGSSTGGGSTGTSVGQGTATGIGASTATSAASASGTATVSGVGASLFVSVGTSSGIGTATAVGFGSGSATGTSTGQGSASGIGSSVAQAIASASGIGIATGVGNSSSTSAIGASAGLATVLGISATIVSAVGTASGNSTVTGISELLLGGKTWYWKKGYDDYVKSNPPEKSHGEQVTKAAAHMSSLGGHARAKSLTSTQRTFIATKAAKARWK